MNTLNKEITKRFFKDENGYEQLVENWKKLNSESASAERIMLYAILRGKDWRKGFSPITNKNKLANGRTEYDSAYLSRAYLYRNTKSYLKIFGDIFSDEAELLIQDVLNSNLPLSECAYREVTLNV